MIKRPKPGDTEEDVLRMQQEFHSERAKNPKMQPAAQIVKLDKQPKQSLFAKARQQKPVKELQTQAESVNSKLIYEEIHDKMVGANESNKTITDFVLGDIVENTVRQPKTHTYTEVKDAASFPKIHKMSIGSITKSSPGKSLFAQIMEQKSKVQMESMDWDESPTQKQHSNLNALYGEQSLLVEDAKLAEELHKENLNVLCQMKEEEIMAERKRLMDSIDPTLVALLAKKRKEKAQTNNPNTTKSIKSSSSELLETMDTAANLLTNDFPASNPAIKLIEQSTAEQWIHFDIVEKDKLQWMRDIPMQAKQLKAGEKFEARFDWKGILLPYSLTEVKTESAENITDDRELYLHGDEPHRPGYTLQELFRLARSNVMQQRVTAFNAIAGMLNIYQQGFYDQVLELPITKIFFLLRFGFDDNTPAMLEVVGKALAYLFYNETDETLLDFTCENPGCQWQPCLEVLNLDIASDNPDSIENLQKHLQQLQVSFKGSVMQADVQENEEESKTSMSDFQLAETDLIDCFLRTNILQRIYFILNCVRPDNSTVSSCLKILIRLARSGKDVALQIVNNDDLMKCLFENFLPGLQKVDTSLETPPFYHYPQYLCLKLLRVLTSCNLGIAVKLININLIDILENYLYNREDIKGKLIKVQIETLRILRCLFLLRIENNTLYKKFLSAFRYLLNWHYNHVIYEEGGPFLIRQHAASLLTTIASINGPVGSEVTAQLGDILHDCCCNWYHKAVRFGVKEFSQATLLSSCLNTVTWYIRHTDTARFQNFINKYLHEFIKSNSFIKFLNTISSSSIVIRDSVDRRLVHKHLPNVGSVIINSYGPQLVIAQTYPIYLITSLWRLMELLLERNEKQLFETLLKPDILEPLVSFLRCLTTRCNRYLATNFFAKMEMKLIFKLLCFEGFNTYFQNSEMLQIVYNYLCCLTAEQIPDIEELFEKVIFNKQFIRIPDETLKKWCKACLELMVYPHYIVVSPSELTLMLPFSQVPILPSDWPYFQLKVLLKNFLENVQHKMSLELSEREILQMTLNFVTQLEECNDKLKIVSPTEKLMYLMIAFMGPESQFLDKEMQILLRQHLIKFYAQSENISFQFDEVYQGKCKFENLYVLFVDHFQAASYGDELFSSLVMIPLAQKYDNKWRRRVWSDYASALRFLNCNENLLIGGLKAYLEPPEDEESLIKEYNAALNSDLVRVDTLPYIIAKHHVDKYKERVKK